MIHCAKINQYFIGNQFEMMEFQKFTQFMRTFLFLSLSLTHSRTHSHPQLQAKRTFRENFRKTLFQVGHSQNKQTIKHKCKLYIYDVYKWLLYHFSGKKCIFKHHQCKTTHLVSHRINNSISFLSIVIVTKIPILLLKLIKIPVWFDENAYEYECMRKNEKGNTWNFRFRYS